MSEKMSYELIIGGMCPWCGQPLEGHPKRCENEDVTIIALAQWREGEKE